MVQKQSRLFAWQDRIFHDAKYCQFIKVRQLAGVTAAIYYSEHAREEAISVPS